MNNETKKSITGDIDSELPFSLKDNGHNINIKDVKGSVICVIYEMAEAKYIQKACNLYPELVEALEENIEDMEQENGVWVKRLVLSDEDYQKAKFLIQKAKQK